jgi:DNA-binding PadR family transcriptional regulator
MYHMAEKQDKEAIHEKLLLELRRGVLVLAVLSQLATAEYGYSLKQELSERGLEINEGTLYPLLRRLESQGLLESDWRVVDDARPRRYYQMSPMGETVLANLAYEWDSLVEVMSGLLGYDNGGTKAWK